MNRLKEYRDLIVIIFAIFTILLVGAIFSHSFTQQRTYMELFMLMGSLLFVFSALVLFAILGFSSFALYLTIFIAAVMVMYGIVGAILVIAITYLIWGFIFSIELLLVDNGVVSAIDWFKRRYDFQSFKWEYYAFYPLLLILYILIELFPNILHGEEMRRFSPKKVFEKMREILE
ncbi:MAG: hypothetical protein U9R27_11985 [Campylobacterota bacterium]|nr:hypothetical protein [Campylobacterota bacterium]